MSRTSIRFETWLATPKPRFNARIGRWELYAPAGKPLTLVERTVLAEYVDRYRHGDDEIAITSGDLEVLTDCCRKKLDAVRAELVEQGLLTVVTRSTGGRGKPTTYRLGDRLIASMRNQARDARFEREQEEAKPGMGRQVANGHGRHETGHGTPGNGLSEPGMGRPVNGEKPGTETGHQVRRNRAPDAPSLERDPRARARGLDGSSLAEGSREPNAHADAPRSESEIRPSIVSTRIVGFVDEIPRAKGGQIS